MFKRLFSFSNPIGLVLSTAALVLSLSPGARKGTRKVLVKGAAALLSAGDQFKGLTAGARKQLGSFVEEAKVEKEQMALPDFSEMVKTAGETTKSKMNKIFDDMTFMKDKTTSGVSQAMEMGDEFLPNTLANNGENTVTAASAPKAAKKNAVTKNKHSSSHRNVQNVLSDDSFNKFMRKPPIQ